uniref:Isochorismatase-like domain-containing protein n=1 Tax=Entomoneis paludosa TaxID=265537 RepID=A0A7S2Y2U7_9STRA|mmetsp:Transcript_12710/g.26359  ORF Transcript_12710/g.26359 Transcript_12710/m.26359 type:complete len:239 (+) Transcript_12710:98-814(+)
MQVDFLRPGGFGSALGNDVTHLQRAVGPCQDVLAAAREAGLVVIHTREGHAAPLLDLHPFKRVRPGQDETTAAIGRPGPCGRILVRGEPGHDIISELYPQTGEAIIDKPGKGCFYATDLECILRAQNISTLLVCGVTTEVCVHTTVREANDRGYHCVVIGNACASYHPQFHQTSLEMIVAQGGIFGSVAESNVVVQALRQYTATTVVPNKKRKILHPPTSSDADGVAHRVSITKADEV